MPGSSHQQDDNQIFWFDSACIPEFDQRWFNPVFLREEQLLTGQAEGRGTTFFFQVSGQDLVLRHYRRGGLPGKILSDQFLFTGLSRTRAWREMSLLMQLQELDLPAPRPVAARVARHGWYYRSDIVTKRIDNASDMHDILSTHRPSPSTWQDIGATIALFHRNQVFHHDLNIHNIMRDNNGKIWLIDFDKCAIKAGDKWKQQNLARLLRSLNKEQQRVKGYHFNEGDWQHLLKGYDSNTGP